MALVARHDITADEYFAMADRLPRFTELIEGVVVVSGPSYRHQHIVGEIYHQLRLWIAAGAGRGACGIPVDVKINDRNVYAPDVWWCGDDLAPSLDEIRFYEVPDLAVEVLSPSTRRYDLGVKRARYDERGLPELWIVDPVVRDGVAARLLRRSAVEVPGFDVERCLVPGGVLESPQLPGFSLALDALLSGGGEA
jgi:Uma2 family endonuclease